jgi:branched-chain amino acid transport system substrate-binding protein
VAAAPHEPTATDPPARGGGNPRGDAQRRVDTANSGARERIGSAFGAGGNIPPETVAYGGPTAASWPAAGPAFGDRVCRQVSWSLPIAGANPLAAAVTECDLHGFEAPMTAEAATAFIAVTIFA